MKNLQPLIAQHGGEGLLLTFLPDVRWVCGFSGSHGALVVTPRGNHFVTDGRYAEQAAEEVHGAEVHVHSGELFAYVADQDLLQGASHVLFQAEHLSVSQHGLLRELLPHVEWLGVDGLLKQHVAEKSRDEVRKLSAAQRLTEAVFDEIIQSIRAGTTEREVAAEIVCAHLRRGAERMAFDPIVAAGAHGALPHARPTNRVIAKGDLVVIDMGCMLDGYASDMTRTVAVGEPGAEARAVYDVVLQAQVRALDAARSGIAANVLDAVARDLIAEAGYAEAFSHSLGHGVGLQVHEWPRVSYRTDEALPEGAVVTIEPGVYLPGRFGVRIEDMIWLRPNGARNLTRTPKSLLILDP